MRAPRFTDRDDIIRFLSGDPETEPGAEVVRLVVVFLLGAMTMGFVLRYVGPFLATIH